MRTARTIAASAALAAALLTLGDPVAAGDATAGALTVSNAWARASAGPVPNGVVYLTIANAGAEDDKLIAVETRASAHAELHSQVMDGDVMRMRPLEALDIAAGATVVLEPGGLHVMLMGLAAPLAEGASLPITLFFENAGQATVEATVMAAGAMAGPMHHEGH